MPNHCETDFNIYGRRDQVMAVIDAHFTADGTLDCDKVIPYPEQYKELDRIAEEWKKTYCDATGWKLKPEYEGQKLERPRDGFNSGGYEWCCDNWGTKWGTYSGNGVILIEHENDTLEAQLSFESAWGPPQPVFDKLAEMYPGLTFRAESFECGMQWQLLQEWKEGAGVTYKEATYDGNRGG